MKRGIMEQNKLVDTLKRIVGAHTKPSDTLEQIVKKYFSFDFLPLKKLTSNGDVIYFIDEKGRPKFSYSPNSRAVMVKGPEFAEIQNMFDMDEDAIEQIFKDWMKQNFDVDIIYVDYYSS